MLTHVISGGQTGSDRGGLNAAIKIGIPHGGSCPRGRKAEDGVIPPRYKLKETLSDQYPVRTEINVVESDGTVVFTLGKAERGSALTLSLCKKHKRPSLHLDLVQLRDAQASKIFSDWLTRERINVLNVAGNRESVAPGIEKRVEEILIGAFILGGHVPFSPRNITERKDERREDGPSHPDH